MSKILTWVDDGKGGQRKLIRDVEPEDQVEVIVKPEWVKKEAERRILNIMDRDKQRNVMAKGLQMVIEHGPDVSLWPPEEQARAAATLTVWVQIEAIRAASNLIEAMNPVPNDFRDDKYWP
jgi:hypothetical protein